MLLTSLCLCNLRMYNRPLQFINTFIDDLFAFIIKMPTMHRLSCFRDDVVFLIYLYQRHVYSVDESRPREK